MDTTLDNPTSGPRFGAIVPVKPPAVAKSRLAALGEAARVDLARAFAVDTVTAVLDCPLVDEVIAVTDDHVLAASLAGTGAVVIPDGVSDDLNGTLALAAAELARRRPGLRPVAVCADLPGLTGQMLADVLGAAPGDRPAFVPDAEDTGTTLVTAPDVASFVPSFGPGSRVAHARGGAVALDAPAGLRRDVDTPADLEAALALGTGPQTRLAATVHRLP